MDELLRRRAMMFKAIEPSILPREYQRVSWVGGNNQMIDLNLSADENDSVFCEFYFSSISGSGNKYVFGFRDSATSNNLQLYCNTISTMSLDYGDYSKNRINSNFATGKWYQAKVENGVYTFVRSEDDLVITQKTLNTVHFRTTTLILLNAQGRASGEGFNGRVSSFTIGDKCNLIPCYRKSDSAIGFYDSVRKAFFVNSGTGNLTKGADV